MKITFVASEVFPFAKTGGLADVCGALPNVLASLGHEVSVIMPAYRQTRLCGQPLVETEHRFDIPIGSKIARGSLLQSCLPGGDVPVYLVAQENYFDREELYRERGEDYKDNCERFVFFCRAAMEAMRALELRPDVIHCHDWQTGLIPAYLKLEYHAARGFEETVTLMTIHNMAYQGQFWHWDMLLTGLDWKFFNWHQMEFYGKLNLLKTGLVFADGISTVSPRYAEEIQTPEQGYGLDGVVHERSDALAGIINGVDYETWDPKADSFLPAQYSSANWQTGKARCKAALQREFQLPERTDVPLLGLIGRLADQKGFDLLEPVLRSWLETHDAQWVVLGTGEPHYHKVLSELAQLYPKKLGVRLDFANHLSHQIEAGADMFLMPSRYEPCGLNQLYSLKYGTVPVVHATGGLADTITDATAEHLAAGTANGFRFENYSVTDLDHALARACTTWKEHPEVWRQLVTTGMNQDWSWSNSAHKYLDLYRSLLARRRRGVLVS